ncbi:MAG: OmpA family protein [Rhodothermales bacterium]
MRQFVVSVMTLAILFTPGVLAAQDVGEGLWANYDFVPGHRVLAYHDFDAAYVGNFPDRMTYLEGEMDIVRLPDGNQALRTRNTGRFVVPLEEALPARFTVEFRVHATDARSFVMMYSTEEKGAGRSPGKTLAALVGSQATGLTVGKYAEGPKSTRGMPPAFLVEDWVNVRIAVDGPYWKMYVDETRVANIPQVDFPRGNGLAFYLSMYPYDGDDLFVDDIRIAEGGRAILYDQLSATGKVITKGILFDTDSDRIRPESTPTLMDIAAMLEQHPELRLRIEGHTDDTGSATHNKPLSERRAAAVKAWLVGKRGVDASRLESAGLGAEQPVAGNDTAEGRQQNRRVELHRL